MKASRYSPSRADVNVLEGLRENLGYLRNYAVRRRAGFSFTPIFRSVEEYDELSRSYRSAPLAGSRVLEVGFGARPHRFAVLRAMGIDARAVDIEVPLLDLSPSRLRRVLATNGIERFAKSMARHVLFDRREWSALDAELARRGLRRHLDEDRLVVADASSWDAGTNSADLIVSEDVFEHVPRDRLEPLVARMAEWLAPDGLALVRPNVFTGITGGHLVEWNRLSFRRGVTERQSEPWEHLRRRRFRPNTQLNELTRADYRELFGRHFVIEEERVLYPDLGREFLDAGVREELSDWPEEELMSNLVQFVLRHRNAGNADTP